jgi:hypothetical protein
LLSSPATARFITSRSREVSVASDYAVLRALPADRELCRLVLSFQRLLNRIEQILVADRLGQKLHGPGFHRADPHRDIAMASDEDNGDFDPGITRSPLQIKPLNPSFSTHRQNALFFGLNRPRSRFNKGRGVPEWL